MTRPLIWCVSLATVLAAGACKTTSVHGGEPAKRDAVDEEPRVILPDPLPLPDDPPAVLHLANPGEVLRIANAWAGDSLRPRGQIRRTLERATTSELAELVADAADTTAPWSIVKLDDHGEVARIAITEDGAKALQAALGALPAAGDFGAVAMPPPTPAAGTEPETTPKPEPAWLAWFDAEHRALSIAHSERGLVTGRELPKRYGTAPIFFSVAGAQLQLPLDLPITRVTGRGSIDSLAVTAQLEPGSDPIGDLQIGEGSLGGLLDDPSLAVGATTRWLGHKDAVKKAIARVDRQVQSLPFLLRGFAVDMQKRFNSVARSWDGRVLIAAGPKNHVRLAYGAKDAKASGHAVLRLIAELKDNVDIMRMVSSDAPKIGLKKNADEGAGEPIHVFSLSRASAYLPRAYHGLIDDKGKLRVAMSWPARFESGVIVAGPNARSELKHWLDSVADAPTAQDTKDQLGAVRVAVAPGKAQDLRKSQTLDAVLGLEASERRWDLAAHRPSESSIELLLERSRKVRSRAAPRRPLGGESSAPERTGSP